MLFLHFLPLNFKTLTESFINKADVTISSKKHLKRYLRSILQSNKMRHPSPLTYAFAMQTDLPNAEKRKEEKLIGNGRLIKNIQKKCFQ